MFLLSCVTGFPLVSGHPSCLRYTSQKIMDSALLVDLMLDRLIPYTRPVDKNIPNKTTLYRYV